MISGNRGNCILELRKQPHPRPLSEWRGAWTLLVGWERMVNGNRGNCILKLKRRPSAIEKGVSSLWKEPFFTPTKRSLYLQIIVFTPLSIRRGVGGEAFLYLQTMVFTPLSIRRGVGGEAFPYLQIMVFTPLSIRRGVGGEAFLYLQIVVFTPLSIRRGDGGEAVLLWTINPIIIDEICLFNNEKIINSFFFRTFAVG